MYISIYTYHAYTDPKGVCHTIYDIYIHIHTFKNHEQKTRYLLEVRVGIRFIYMHLHTCIHTHTHTHAHIHTYYIHTHKILHTCWRSVSANPRHLAAISLATFSVSTSKSPIRHSRALRFITSAVGELESKRVRE